MSNLIHVRTVVTNARPIKASAMIVGLALASSVGAQQRPGAPSRSLVGSIALPQASADGGPAGSMLGTCIAFPAQTITDASNPGIGPPVAMSGDWAVTGAPNGPLAGPGVARVYHFDGTQWQFTQTLTGSAGENGDAFGASVAIEGDTIVIGAPLDDHPGVSNAGSAYVFTRSGSTWTELTRLSASDAQASDKFGTAVALSGDAALIGAPEDDDGASNAGSAYAFRRTAGVWAQEQKLAVTTPQVGRQVGFAVDIDDANGRLVLGMNPNVFVGAAYPFHRSMGTWVADPMLTASDASLSANYGRSVSIDGNHLVVGAPNRNVVFSSGSVYAYTFNAGAWGSEQIISAPDTPTGVGPDDFGRVLDIQNQTLLIAAPLDDVLPYAMGLTSNDSGSVYIYRMGGASWGFDRRLNLYILDSFDSPPLTTNSQLGSGAAISGDRVLATALRLNMTNVNGLLVAFDLLNPDCDANGRPDTCDPDLNHNLLPDACDIASGHSGDCDLDNVPDEVENGYDYQIEDGIGGLVWGYGGVAPGVDFIWLNQYTVTPGNRFITHIAPAWTSYAPEGTPITYMIYDDPNNDGNPSDAVLLRTAQSITHDRFGLDAGLTFTIDPIERTYVGDVGDSFFIGAKASCTPNVYVAVLSTFSTPSSGRSWRFSAALGTANLGNLSLHGAPILMNGNWALRALNLDCNGNGVWDSCDLAAGTSLDVNLNGIPDECEIACVADINGNGVVNTDDLIAVVTSWGTCPGGCPPSCPADIVGNDCAVNTDDLIAIITGWGSCH